MGSDPLIGTALEHYVLERRLGAGGMGVVYVARDEKLGRSVAIKLLPGGRDADTQARQRFQREIRLAATVEHPDVVPVYDGGFSGDHFFIAMRLIRGPSLGELLVAEGPLDPGRALRLF